MDSLKQMLIHGMFLERSEQRCEKAMEDKLQELKASSMFTKMSAKLAIIVCGNLSNALPKQMAEFWIQDCSVATETCI